MDMCSIYILPSIIRNVHHNNPHISVRAAVQFLAAHPTKPRKKDTLSGALRVAGLGGVVTTAAGLRLAAFCFPSRA
jgi:hypothetical protein